MTNGESIVAELPRIREAAEKLRETFLAHLTLLGEVPAPTFNERDRAILFAERLAEAGLVDCSVDEKGNASGRWPGSETRPPLLLVTNSDTILPEHEDPTIAIQIDRVIGPFVGDNAIALASMATLPALFDRLAIRLRSDVVFVGAARTLGRGNMEGIKHFLGNSSLSFAAGICLESLQLGRLNYTSMGMFRGSITCRLPADYNWTQFGSTSTIIPMAEVINRISRIPLPPRPLTNIVMGSIEGGISFNNIARETQLGFEVRSESADILRQIREQIEDITEDVSGQSGKQVQLDVFAQREPGGLDIGHPLVKHARAILTGLNVQPALYATTSLMSALRDAGVPAVTLGLTTGERKSELEEIEESVAILPLAVGLAQVAALLLASDGGLGA